ncbi:Uma2 family endonuclease [Fulvimarina sp. MAC8]|uniref:Uma2 family endonuclease n=1 Tax=Fulvimarina sp. MAC8 TaxID=3162874 RepID=UPI0032EBE32C
MSAEDFVEWATHQKSRYELLDGVPIEMMTGAKMAHNIVVGNLSDALRAASKGHGCSTMTSDMGVICREYQVRYPDVVVDCSPVDPDTLAARNPVILVEVLSKSTSQIDLTNKLDEYRSIPSVEMIVFVDPDFVSVKVYRRASPENWLPEMYVELSQKIAFPVIGATVALSAIYDTLSPRPFSEASTAHPRA